jgi:hypothetical protein
VKPSLSLLLLVLTGISQVTTCPAAVANAQGNSRVAPANADQSAASPGAEPRLSIPGPLRSFLRMGGISQDVPPPQVLPLLAHNVVLQGYERGRPTEFLILLRRYVHQAQELRSMAGPDGNIHVHGCKDVESLLRALGYRQEGACGHTEMSLITANPERAFLTIDSGFPLLDLEEALRRDAPFDYAYAGTSVPVLSNPEDWIAIAAQRSQEKRDFLEVLLNESDMARLYWGLSQIEPETRAYLIKNIGMGKLLPFATILDLYGSQLCVRNGTVVVPGGQKGEKEWQELVGASPQKPAEFVPQLLKKDRGWLAVYFDAMARTSESEQAHFAENQRLRRFYAAFRSPGTSSEAETRVTFRPAPALLVLVTRLQWETNGDPYVPGSLQVWSEVVSQSKDSKFSRDWTKHSNGWKSGDQLLDAMFVFSRQESVAGPLQAYLCLSELDHRRPAGRRLNSQTVALMAKRYADYSDQYLIFSEFPELSDDSIIRFVSTADGLSKIPDHTLRGNAMGIFEANVGLWQILARQAQIDRSQLNSSWQEMIKPFASISTGAQLVTAGRTSLDQVFRTASGKPTVTEDGMINLLAGTRQTSAEGQQVLNEVANRIRSVLDDQRLVSIDTLFTLDDDLKNATHGTPNKDELAARAGELREFEMPRPIFTNSERNVWAAGTYNNRHTELEMRTDIVKLLRGPATPKQIETARGELATFLRDSLVGMNYAYYEPPGSQALHNNPLFVRSHDFSGETVIGIERVWQTPSLFGMGSPAGGGAHLIGSLADLPYVLAEAEQDFIAPDHVQALIWQQFVPALLSNAIVPRWWNVSRNELHAVTLYQKAGEDLLTACSTNDQLRTEVIGALSQRMLPERLAWLQHTIREGNRDQLLEGIAPADSFYLAAEFQQKYPEELAKASPAGQDLENLIREDPNEVGWERLSRDFGVIHPVLLHTYTREFVNERPFPALDGPYNRLMAESWDSGNLYWARLADEMGYSPVLLNRLVPELTRRMVERIFASDLEDWPATLRALRETGEEFRQGKISSLTRVPENRN